MQTRLADNGSCIQGCTQLPSLNLFLKLRLHCETINSASWHSVDGAVQSQITPCVLNKDDEVQGNRKTFLPNVSLCMQQSCTPTYICCQLTGSCTTLRSAPLPGWLHFSFLLMLLLAYAGCWRVSPVGGACACNRLLVAGQLPIY